MASDACEQWRRKSCEVEVNCSQQHDRVAEPEWLNSQTGHDQPNCTDW